MARTMQHVEALTRYAYRVAFLEPAVRRHGARARNAIGFAGLGQAFEQEGILVMGSFDRNAELGRKLRRSTGVIDMAMREDDLLDGHSGLGDGVTDSWQIPSRIDHHALHRLVI